MTFPGYLIAFKVIPMNSPGPVCSFRVHTGLLLFNFHGGTNYEKNVIRHDGRCDRRLLSSQAASSSTTETTAAASSAEETTTAAESTAEASSEAASAETSGDETVVRVGGLKGPTTMGLVKLMVSPQTVKQKTTTNLQW